MKKLFLLLVIFVVATAAKNHIVKITKYNDFVILYQPVKLQNVQPIIRDLKQTDSALKILQILLNKKK